MYSETSVQKVMELSTFRYDVGEDSYISRKGEYFVEDTLGSGTYGTVYQTTGKRVIKLIQGVKLEDFKQEALVQTKTYEAVPNSCPKIHDVGTLKGAWESPSTLL